MKKETWKPVPGYEGKYEASTAGRVRSLDRLVLYADGRVRVHPGKILSPVKGSNKYLQVFLSDSSNKRKNLSLHEVVARTFLGPRPSGALVLHRNGQREDCRKDNLRYGSYSENEQDKTLHTPVKLSWVDVRNIRQRLHDGEKPRDIAPDYGVTARSIRAIRSGQCFGYVPQEGQ